MPKFTDGNGDRKFIKGPGRKTDLDLGNFESSTRKKYDSKVDKILAKYEEDKIALDKKIQEEEERRKELSRIEEQRLKLEKKRRKQSRKAKEAAQKRRLKKLGINNV